jgi:catechol 2,3-dioxygenase-like lactoylglutathione lyase family enzyme
MFSHISLGTNDFSAALDFYRPLMKLLGLTERFCDPEKVCAARQTAGADRPLFVIGAPFNGAKAAPANGGMVAFLAQSHAIVDEVYRLALANGGACEGPPGLRPHYHPNYYGAYFRDLDGNKICVCNHDPPGG